MLSASDVVVNPENEWRLQATKPKGWARDVRSGAAKKYFIVSCDSHMSPPITLFSERLDQKWHHLLPKFEKHEGKKVLVQPGVRPAPIVDFDYKGEDALRVKAGARLQSTTDEGIAVGSDRIQELEFDGIDAEVVFPNGAALLVWASTNSEFVNAQCQVWNDWALEECAPFADRMKPTACLVTADVDMAVAEVERVAKMGYKILCLPCKPVFGPPNVADINYNLPVFDKLWAAIQDHDMAITYHGATGRDPRTARGNGGAVINFIVHGMAQGMEPIVNMCASGVFEKFPRLRAATIECDAGWVPWFIEKLDESYKKHHFWARPRLKELPSQYYRNNCYASFGEDRAAAALVEKFGLENNFMWANDFPHHEGSWPHSAEAIYRTLDQGLKEETRAKVLGLNAAKCFGFPVPEKLK